MRLPTTALRCALLALTSLLFAFSSASADSPLRTKWAVQTDGPVRGEAVVHDGKIYFGSSDGVLRAVNAADGSLLWSFETGGAIAGAPAVTDDLVIVAGRGLTVFALNRTDGSVRWTFETGPTLPTLTSWNYFTAAPVVDGDRVLVPSGDGFLYALDLATGAEQWRFQTQDSLRASPLVADGVVYQPSGDDYVYALDAATGTEHWRFATEGVNYDLNQGFIRSDIFSRPLIADGKLVIASRDSNVYAIDLATREAAWTFTYNSTWAMTAALHDGLVYVGWSTNNKVSAIDLATGELAWDDTTDAHNYTTALIHGDLTLWGSADGHLHAYDRTSGEKKWSHAVGSEIYGSPVLAEDVILIGTDDGRLLALTDDGGNSPGTRKAVYLPEGIPGGLRGFIPDEQLTPYLTARGYELLNTEASLAAWVEARTTDGSRSALVFGYPMIPADVIGEEPAAGPLRTYLEAGGKVIWPWGMPNKLTFNADGSFRAYDPTIAERLLEVKVLGFEDGGNYHAKATTIGRNWGFPATFKTTFSYLDPESFDDVTILAIDEYGRPGTFVKTFTDKPGTGWVNLLPSAFGVKMSDQELALIDQIASYTLE